MEDEKNLMEEEDTQKDKYLTFSLGDEVYGIDIRVVIEIIGIQKITNVPEVPDYVRGIINLRGKIIRWWICACGSGASTASTRTGPA